MRSGIGSRIRLTLHIIQLKAYNAELIKRQEPGRCKNSYLFRVESLSLALELHLQLGFATLTDNSEWPVLHIRLDSGVFKLATNQTLGICKK